MSGFSESDFYKIGTAIELETELYEISCPIYKSLTELDYSEEQQYELGLSEAFSTFCKWDYFVQDNPNLYHMDFGALSRSWKDLYHEMKDVILDKEDPNTSWLTERWENYEHWHSSVDTMLRSNYDDLKEKYQ